MIIKGVPITLYVKTKTGTDPFGADIYDETPITVDNVLISPIDSNDITEATNLVENVESYKLCIPKGDKNTWKNTKVEFWGKQWQTVGDAVEYIEAMTPLSWNKQIKVERYEN